MFRDHLTPSKYARKNDFAVTSTPTLERERTRVRLRRCPGDGDGCQVCGRHGPPPRPVSPHAASSMLEKWNHNKNGTKDIGIQVFDEILQLGVGYMLIA